MAPVEAGEPEYESDPEELKRSLATRRREASDDDDDGDVVKNLRAEIDSDQSDEQVGTAKYDSDENKSEDEEDIYAEEEGGEYRDLVVDEDKKSNMMMAVVDAADHIDGEEEKKKQSSTVPTGGAFYMHDDRFREMSAGRSRRMRGGRNPWGSGDERKWGHDKFEEMNTLEKHNDKTSRGRFRGRGRAQGRGYTKGSSSNASSRNRHQIFVPKAVTQGGEPGKYEIPLSKGNQTQSVQSKQLRHSHGPQNSHEKMLHLDSRRSPTAPAKTGNEGISTKKNLVASSLSSASPPFYPSVSSSNLVHSIQVGMERFHMNKSATPSEKKYRSTKSVFSPVCTAQTSQSTSQGRGAPAAGKVVYPQSRSEGDRFSTPMQFNGDSNDTGQICIRPSSQGESESALETGALITKGKGTLQPRGSRSFKHSGSQVMGQAESLASGENSNFPTFLPVMQFGGQHGGVPTFGMAFPGYVQSENGVGNPEMTWMPVLTGPGALGASYSPPYTAIDGSYQAQKPGLPSSAGTSSKENTTNNFNDQKKPIERPEITGSVVSKLQNNPSKQPRRYSEMSFSK